MDLVSTKICVAILFAILRFSFGILPLKLYKLLLRWEGEDDSQHFINKRRHKQVTCALNLCQSFGGGVLFATCFLHMMPEVYQSMEVLKQYGNLVTDFPLSQMTISLGFFLVYFVEEFSHWFITKVPDAPCKKKIGAVQEEVKSRPITALSNNKVVPFKDISRPPSAFVIEDNNYYIEDYKEKLDSMSDTYSIIQDEVLKENEKNNKVNKEKVSLERSIDLSEDSEIIPEEQREKEKEYISSQKMVRQILVVIALSLHSVFEGLAIGIQQSTANIWYLFVAVIIHSATILFYISMQLILAKAPKRVIIIHVLVLSSTSSIGVLLGLLITLKADMNTQAKSTAVVLLEGLSAGTILYITFFEVLNKEKEKRSYSFRRALCILGGFVLMALLQCWEMHVD